jgi:UPF0271 protein
MTPRIDLNCDLGEGAGQDVELMPLISSANIACGAHAGDDTTMRATVALAKANWVSVGAHPGYEDRENFGRKEMELEPKEVFALVARQIAALKRITDEAGVALTHVKPHGALYNLAARDAVTARAIAEAVWAASPELVLYGLAGSESIRAGQAVGLHVASEVFADRLYLSDGSLVPRSQPGAVHTTEEAMIAQVIRMVERGMVQALDGCWVAMHADTLCLHGDGPHAVSFAKTIRKVLLDTGVQVRPCVA